MASSPDFGCTHTVTLLFGDSFFATVSGLVAGFFVGAIFALLADPFYAFGVVAIAAIIGYSLADRTHAGD